MRAGSLTARFDRVDLPAGASAWRRVVGGEADRAAPRTITVQASRTCEVRITWTAGHAGHQVELSLGRATRVCIWARSVQVDAANLDTNNPVRVSATIADGWEDTSNQLIRKLGGLPAAQTVSVPDFARTVRLELADPTSLATAYVDILDPGGTLRARTMGDAQPEHGISLAGAASLSVLAPVDGRLVFDLVL